MQTLDLGMAHRTLHGKIDVVPDPMKLVNEFKFEGLVGQGASKILFTNGLNDLWHIGSYLESLSDSILSIIMPNGAHQSESHYTNEDGVVWIQKM